MSFDLRISKQAHAVIFSCKRTIIFRACSQKLNILPKENKTVGVIRMLQNILPQSALFTIYKCSSSPAKIKIISHMIKHSVNLFTKKLGITSI